MALDEYLDKEFHSESDKIQIELVEHVLLPLANEIMKEDPVMFAKLMKPYLPGDYIWIG